MPMSAITGRASTYRHHFFKKFQNFKNFSQNVPKHVNFESDPLFQAWTALYDLSNIFEVFLPQLLQYPNAADPLNGEAARMYMHRREEYDRVVRGLFFCFVSESFFYNTDIKKPIGNFLQKKKKKKRPKIWNFNEKNNEKHQKSHF